MGYNDNLTGTWPTNYITQANKVGILDDVAIVASAAAKRADVVVMLDDALDSQIVTYDKDTNEFVMKQNKIADSDDLTLLEDSFKGQVVEYTEFVKVDQVRDAADETLTWNVGTEKKAGDAPYESLIIDKDTKVSHNAASLFDLEGHQGKVYFIKDGSKYYARFIEVKSYTKTVTDTPTLDASGKIKVGKTNYNAVKNPVMTAETDKNTNFVLYFNDNDQVYLVKSDKDFTEKAYYVKSIGNTTIKLIGEKNVTASMKDDETLIWDGDEFIAPSELKVGDAIMEITENELYTKIAEATGEMTKVNDGASKATIGGKTYKFNSGTYFDDKFEDASLTDEEVLGNNVKYILNKNNVIAAIVVDESSTGNKLYGIVVDGAQGNTSWANRLSGVTIFTSEGKEVTYDLDLDSDPTAKDCLGRLVEYQLNKDGEIDKWTIIDGARGAGHDGEVLSTGAAGSDGNEVEVKNNTYLQGTVNGTTKTVTLSANAVIFEVSIDSKGYLDPSIVIRSSLLSGGDFIPTALGDKLDSAGDVPKDKVPVYGLENDDALRGQIDAYAVYITNSNGAAKALAYTDANSKKFNFGVVASYNFSDADGDNNITFTGDETVYDLGNPKYNTSSADREFIENDAYKAGDDALVIYTLSGSKINIVKAYAKKTGVENDELKVKGYNDGLMVFEGGKMTVWDDASQTHSGGNHVTHSYAEIMTDDDTVVYVMNSNTGKFELGGLDDIYKGAYVYVPLVDKDQIADLVVVDEYTPNEETYRVTLDASGDFGEGNAPYLTIDGGTTKVYDRLSVQYKGTVELVIPQAAFSGNTIKVDGKVVSTPSGDHKVNYTIKANQNIIVTCEKTA